MKLRPVIEMHFKPGHFDGGIVGELYPPPVSAQILSTVTSSIWFSGLAFLFAGDFIVTSLLGFQREPEPYKLFKENKLVAGVALFALNVFGSKGLSTGAFECYYNGQLVHSKLQTGRAPSGEVSEVEWSEVKWSEVKYKCSTCS